MPKQLQSCVWQSIWGIGLPFEAVVHGGRRLGGSLAVAEQPGPELHFWPAAPPSAASWSSQPSVWRGQVSTDEHILHAGEPVVFEQPWQQQQQPQICAQASQLLPL